MEQARPISELTATLRQLITLFRSDAHHHNPALDSKTLNQTAFFAMTRILMLRLWEDTGIVQSKQRSYEEINQDIDRVLRETYCLTSNGRSWLFNREYDFTWYQPKDHILNEALQELARFRVNEMHGDVLGPIYESHIEYTSRKNKGQYYTPPEIISFIWDRVGFANPKDLFIFKNGKRRPKRIFDPATGSGGFLVEAARRIVESTPGDADFSAVRNAITQGLYGCEIQSFPHYIAEVNLIIQLTPVIKTHDINQPVELHIINEDSLSFHSDSTSDMDSEFGDFDYVCSNPPFIGEKGNKELFRNTIKKHPYWEQFYQGKMDYLYWFIILGLSKLKEGGKLGFITTSYWLTADGASKLRGYITENAVIHEIIDFEDTSVFGGAPGQHNMIFIMERCSDQQRRSANQIKFVRIKKDLKSGTLAHLAAHIDKSSYNDEYIHIFPSPSGQENLDQTPWNFAHSTETMTILDTIKNNGTPLGDICGIHQGIISGADKVTSRNIKLLPDSLIAKHSIKTGDGIFVLSEAELRSLDLNESERTLIKPFCKNSDISRYHVSWKKPRFLIYTTRETDISKYPKIETHLEKFRPILENKREYREGKLPWFSLHWAREQHVFETQKIVTPNRAAVNTFALCASPLYAMSDVFFITEGNHEESLQYILALLNSKVINFWFTRKRKGKGDIREYVGRPLSQVPIHRIDFSNPSEVRMHDRLVQLSENIPAETSTKSSSIQQEIDAIVLNLYGLQSATNLLYDETRQMRR